MWKGRGRRGHRGTGKGKGKRREMSRRPLRPKGQKRRRVLVAVVLVVQVVPAVGDEIVVVEIHLGNSKYQLVIEEEEQ